MTISRATMKQQLKGNRMKKKMKKKPVTKAFMGLLTASPSLKFMKDKGIISGGALGLGQLAAKALKKKKKGAASPAAQAPQGMTATPMAAATPLRGGGSTIGTAMRVIKKSSPEKFANFQQEVSKKFGGDPNFNKAMRKIGVPTLAAAPRMMSSGGSLNRKRSIDGIAQRGKTRAK